MALRRPPRGFILPFALLLSAMLSMAASSLIRKLNASAIVSGDLVGRKKAFFAADGAGRAIVRRAASYTSSTGSPNLNGLRASVSTTFIDAVLPPGFTRDGAFILSYLGSSPPSGLPSGPFVGMQAKQQHIQFALRIRDNATKSAGFTRQTVSLAQISMFQFFMFVDHPLAGVDTPPGATWLGRLHVNGDICLGSGTSNGGQFNFETVTASSRIMNGNRSGSSECKYDYNGGTTNIRNKDDNGWAALSTSNDHLVAGWKATALSTWGTHAQDSDHDVPVLKPPTIGKPVAQAGRDMGGTVLSNGKSDGSYSNSRFLVDPPQVDSNGAPTETTDILDQKMACKADLRIINGIWFLKAANTTGCDWPGTPIWSDHPGNYTTVAGVGSKSGGIEGNNISAGQANLFPSGSKPNRYSYYETDSNNRIKNDTVGVVSYGPLAWDGTNNKFVPGYIYKEKVDQQCAATTGTGNGKCLCYANAAGTAYSPGTGGKVGNAVGSNVCKWRLDGNVSSGGGLTALTVSDQLVQGTRSGFLDPRVAKGTSDADGRILPINFDVAAFVAALQDTSGSELGAKFNGRTFNGIVFVSSGWTNSQTEYGSNNLAPMWPTQGGLTDGNQFPGYSGGLTQEALPYPLCSGSLTASNDLVSSSLFKHAPCSSANLGTPNALRIHNGATISSAALPKGLTIVTNLPVYLLGDYNTSSDTSSATATPWIPSLIGGDAVVMLSNSFRDDGNRTTWDSTATGTFSGRTASDTTYNTCILAGWVGPTSSSNGGLNNFPRFMEQWSGISNNFRGSMVNGFYSVYARQNFTGSGTSNGVYTAPTRNWSFDPHLNSIDKQPPGAPVFTVSATKKWARD